MSHIIRFKEAGEASVHRGTCTSRLSAKSVLDDHYTLILSVEGGQIHPPNLTN